MGKRAARRLGVHEVHVDVAQIGHCLPQHGFRRPVLQNRFRAADLHQCCFAAFDPALSGLKVRMRQGGFARGSWVYLRSLDPIVSGESGVPPSRPLGA